MQTNLNEYAPITHSQSVAIHKLHETNAILTSLTRDLTIQISNLQNTNNQSNQQNRNG